PIPQLAAGAVALGSQFSACALRSLQGSAIRSSSVLADRLAQAHGRTVDMGPPVALAGQRSLAISSPSLPVRAAAAGLLVLGRSAAQPVETVIQPAATHPQFQ
ncbi:hypothetical protein, partial [Xanthomonas hortorum]